MAPKIKRCGRCNIRKPSSEFNKDRRSYDGLQSLCKPCKLEANREIRARKTEKLRRYEAKRNKNPERRKMLVEVNRRQRAKFPEKDHARKCVEKALRQGALQRLPCIICGNPKAEGHHEDYDKPLEVTWLCRKHHTHLHEGRFCLLSVSCEE